MKIFKCLLFIVLCSSCGTLVNYDYETSTDFTHYKTYNYFDDIETGLSVLDSKRLIEAMDAKLATMGITRSDTPDFYIDMQSQEVQNRNSPNVGVGVGSTGRNRSGGISVGLPLGLNQNTRELVIDFVDDSKSGMFWQAISESNYNRNASPEKREAKFVALVEKIFANYPPEK